MSLLSPSAARLALTASLLVAASHQPAAFAAADRIMTLNGGSFVAPGGGQRAARWTAPVDDPTRSEPTVSFNRSRCGLGFNPESRSHGHLNCAWKGTQAVRIHAQFDWSGDFERRFRAAIHRSGLRS